MDKIHEICVRPKNVAVCQKPLPYKTLVCEAVDSCMDHNSLGGATPQMDHNSLGGATPQMNRNELG